jgi:hypothetical protein
MRKRIVTLTAALTAVAGAGVVSAAAFDASPAAASNPPCYVKTDRSLYCGNVAGVPLRARPSYGTESNPVKAVDRLKSNPSWFKCYVIGQLHSGGNRVWYYTYGDVTHHWGYVPASYVYTPRDPMTTIGRTVRKCY